MDANARWEYALQLHADAPRRSKKCVTLCSGGKENEWRAGPRPKPPSAGDKYEEDGVVARSFLRASRVEQQGHAERRQAARTFDGLSHRQVVQVAQSVDVASLVVRWQYMCALDGVSHTVVEADGWLKPALAAALQAEVDAELKAVSDRANAEAARRCREIERMAQDARAKEQYAKVERTVELKMEAVVEALPAWFEALAGFGEKLAAIKANELGDWDEFNEWLRAEYDETDLEEFTFEDEDDLDIYMHFRAKRAR